MASVTGAKAKPKQKHIELGRAAEELAASYIESLGWNILSRNFSCGRGELDITAMDGAENELVVVEVRCRSVGGVASPLQSPADSVGPKKLRALVSAGSAYADSIGWTGPWRVDLVAVTARPGEPRSLWRLEHIENITDGAYR